MRDRRQFHVDRVKGEGTAKTNSYVKPLVVHFVEMKDRPVATRRDQALDDAQAVLRLGSVFEDAVLVFRATLVLTALEIVLEAYAH